MYLERTDNWLLLKIRIYYTNEFICKLGRSITFMVTRFPQTFSITKVRSKSDVEFIFNNPHCTKNDASRLKRIFELISYPFVIFSESNYIDKVYRDSYYTFFSNKHIGLERNCTRISIFNDISLTLNIEDFSQEIVDLIVLLRCLGKLLPCYIFGRFLQ